MNLKIDFLPCFLNNRNIKQDLQDRIEQCALIKGCVAYWTLDSDFYGEKFVTKVSEENSFFCVDLNERTNVLAIHKLHEKGANFYLCTHKDLKDVVYFKHLMHAKIIIFEFSEGYAEIWCGSHNQTSNSIEGRNIEFSTIITCSQNDKVYSQALKYLESIKSICDKYRPELYSLYRYIQDPEANEKFLFENLQYGAKVLKSINIFGRKIVSFNNSALLILGKTGDEYKQFKTAQNIIITAYDYEEKKSYYYLAYIENIGVINKKSIFSKQITFSERPVCFRFEGIMPVYSPNLSKTIGEEDLKNFSYFINIKIEREISLEKVFSFPDENMLWEDSHSTSELLSSTLRSQKLRTDDKILNDFYPQNYDLSARFKELISSEGIEDYAKKMLESTIDLIEYEKGLRGLLLLHDQQLKHWKIYGEAKMEIFNS
jgi:hypothetical protein